MILQIFDKGIAKEIIKHGKRLMKDIKRKEIYRDTDSIYVGEQK